jgi:hypothetical protein
MKFFTEPDSLFTGNTNLLHAALLGAVDIFRLLPRQGEPGYLTLN